MKKPTVHSVSEREIICTHVNRSYSESKNDLPNPLFYSYDSVFGNIHVSRQVRNDLVFYLLNHWAGEEAPPVLGERTRGRSLTSHGSVFLKPFWGLGGGQDLHVL